MDIEEKVTAWKAKLKRADELIRECQRIDNAIAQEPECQSCGNYFCIPDLEPPGTTENIVEAMRQVMVERLEQAKKEYDKELREIFK
jgi:hypothetical protein